MRLTIFMAQATEHFFAATVPPKLSKPRQSQLPHASATVPVAVVIGQEIFLPCHNFFTFHNSTTVVETTRYMGMVTYPQNGYLTPKTPITVGLPCQHLLTTLRIQGTKQTSPLPCFLNRKTTTALLCSISCNKKSLRHTRKAET